MHLYPCISFQFVPLQPVSQGAMKCLRFGQLFFRNRLFIHVFIFLSFPPSSSFFPALGCWIPIVSLHATTVAPTTKPAPLAPTAMLGLIQRSRAKTAQGNASTAHKILQPACARATKAGLVVRMRFFLLLPFFFSFSFFCMKNTVFVEGLIPVGICRRM